MNSEDIKYTENAEAVVVLEETKHGILVRPVYESPEGEMYVSSYNNEVQLVQRVFNEPPRPKCHQLIEDAEKRLNELNQQCREKQTEIASIDRSLEAARKKAAGYAGLENLFDFIDGKITHYVVVEGYKWSGPDIVKFEDAVTGNKYERVKPQKLLTLFGGSKGKLNWRLSHYSDGSGGPGMEVIPCCSYEEAKRKATEILHAKMAEGPSQGMLDCADKLGIEPIPGYREAVAAQHIEAKRKKIASLDTEISALRAELGQMAIPA